MRVWGRFALLLGSLMPAGAWAGEGPELKACAEAGVGIEAIELPAAKNVRSFYGDKVTVYRVNTEEPAASPYGLALVIPTGDDQGGFKCIAVLRFAMIDLSKAKSSYDAKKGLLLSVPNKVYDGNEAKAVDGRELRLRVNLKDATVKVER